MRKAVVYYRTRPGEPDASGLALRLQREAVRKALEESSLDLIGEFTEREGESETEGYPAYVAAARMAHGQGELVEFLIASRAAIGFGEPFKEPDIEFEPPDDQDIFGQGFITCELLTPSVEHASEITLPNGAPGPLCLYADFRSQADECWEEAGTTFEQRWAAVPPRTCVQVAWLNHIIWDDVRRHRVTYSDVAGRRLTAQAHDRSLTPNWLAQDPGKVWVALSPARTMVQAAFNTRHEETP